MADGYEQSQHLIAGFLEGLIVPIIRGPLKFGELTEGSISFSFESQNDLRGAPSESPYEGRAYLRDDLDIEVSR